MLRLLSTAALLLVCDDVLAEPPSEDVRMAESHIESFLSNLEAVQSGTFEFSASAKGNSGPGSSGLYTFDIASGQATYSQLARNTVPMYWCRDMEKQYVYHGRTPDRPVFIHHRLEFVGLDGLNMPFDFRSLVCLQGPRVEAANLPVQNVRETLSLLDVFEVNASENEIRVVLQSPHRSVERAITSLPDPPRRKILDLLNAGVAPESLPIKRLRHVLYFSANETGQLIANKYYTCPWGSDDWKLTEVNNVTWKEIGGVRVPVSLSGINVAGEKYLVNLEWKHINPKKGTLKFGVHHVDELRGKAMLDMRPPQPNFVGIVGKP